MMARPAGPNVPKLKQLLVLVFLVALAVRAAHLVSLLASPVADTLVLDSKHYDAAARAAEGPGVSFMNVGYAYWLAVVYRIAGPSVRAALWTQIVLGALVAVAVAGIGALLLESTAIGVCAGLLYALYRPAVFYDGLLLTPSITNVAVAGMLLALAVWIRVPRRRMLVTAGLLVGAAILIRPNLLLIVPIAAMAIAGRRNVSRAAWRGVLLFLACAVMPPAIVTCWNGCVHHEWVPVSANGGMNFWVGNGSRASGLYALSSFLEDEEAATEERRFLEEARRRTSDPNLTLGESSAFWFRQGLREIRSSPRRWFVLELRKLALFSTRDEPKTNVSLAFIESMSPALSALPIGFGALVIVGVAGLAAVVGRGFSPEAWLIVSTPLAALATCLAFFVSGEYRHLASIGLAVAAAAMLQRLGSWMLRARRELMPPADLAIPVILATVVTPLVLVPQPSVIASSHPLLDFSNYAREIIRDRPNGTPASRSDFARAERLLAMAPKTAGGELLLLEAELQVSCRAAHSFGDRDHAEKAARAVRRLSEWDRRDGFAGYTERFVRQLRVSMAACDTENSASTSRVP